MDEWFVQRDGRVSGPFTLEQLRDDARRGDLRAEHRIARRGSTEWNAASEHADIAADLGIPPPQRPYAASTVASVNGMLPVAEPTPPASSATSGAPSSVAAPPAGRLVARAELARAALVVVGGFAAFCVLSLVVVGGINAHRIREQESLRTAEEQRDRAADDERARAFTAMTPAQHLEAASAVVQDAGSGFSLDFAIQHLDAIPSSAAEATNAAALRAEIDRRRAAERRAEERAQRLEDERDRRASAQAEAAGTAAREECIAACLGPLSRCEESFGPERCVDLRASADACRSRCWAP